MNKGNNLVLDIPAEHNCTLPTLKSVECGHDLESCEKVTPISRQYIPSDSLQLERAHESANESSSRVLARRFQFFHGPALPRSNAALDLLVTIFCFATVHLVYLGSLDFVSHRTITLFGSLVLIILTLSAGGIYSSIRPRDLNSELTRLFLCWMSAFAAVGLFAFLSKTAGDVSRVWITASMMFSLVLLAGVRVMRCLEFTARNNAGARDVIICGDSASIKPVMHSLYKLSNSRVRVAKIFEFSTPINGQTQSSDLLQNSAKQISDFIENRRQSGDPIAQVWIAVPAEQTKIVEKLSETLLDSPVDVCVVPDQYTERLLKGDVARFGETNVVNISEISLSPAADQFKRVFDVFIASVALLFLSIPMAVIALLVKMESPGPVLFRQKRYGIDGKVIEILKFRSMCVHSDTQVQQATKNDARVTQIGRVLRSTSLDELPQLINVVSGSMSLVGPRPHAVVHNELWRTQIEGYMLRHKVRPGITGWAQVNGWRGETDTDFKMRQRVKFDLEYIRNWSPWLDIQIMFYTVVKGFHDKNAY